MNTHSDSSTTSVGNDTPAEPIAMATNSNVRSSNQDESTAQTLTPNVRSVQDGEQLSNPPRPQSPPDSSDSESCSSESTCDIDVGNAEIGPISRNILSDVRYTRLGPLLTYARRQLHDLERNRTAAQLAVLWIRQERQHRRAVRRRVLRYRASHTETREEPLEEQALSEDWQQYYDRTSDVFQNCNLASAIRTTIFDKTGICLPVLMAKAKSGELDQKISGEIEKLGYLYTAVKEQSSWTGVAATVMLYVRTHYDGNILNALLTMLQEYFTTLEPQAEEKAGSWMDTLKMVHTNWKMATQNEGFQHISKVLSVLIGAGMIEASALQFDVAGLKLFSDICVPKHTSCFDVFDAALGCVTFFIEGGYECIQAGSVTPLLFGERDFSKFDDTFLECKNAFDFAQPGNCHMIDTDENSVVKKLSDAITEGKRLVQVSKSPFTKKLLLDRVIKLQEMESKLLQHRLSSGVRVKPFCAVAFGPTGVGKSTIAPLLMYHILATNGFDASDDACVMMKAGQKHEENYRTHINGVYYDDFANTNPKFIQESPCEDLLDTVNTAKITARMAALELKNKVSKQPKGVVVSTNVKDLNAPTYSMEPTSITRRGDVFLTFKVRPQFQTNSQLDSKKVEEYYDGEVPAIPDLWTIDCEISVPIPNPTPGKPSTIGWQTIVWNGRPLSGVDMKTALQYITVASRRHFQFQNKMVERSTDLASKMAVCPSCKGSLGACVCSLEDNITFAPVKVKSTTVKATPPKRPTRVTTPPVKKKKTLQEEYEEDFEDSTRSKLAAKMFARKWNKDGTLKQQKKDPPLEEHAVTDTVLQYVRELQQYQPLIYPSLVPQRFVRSYSILCVVETFLAHPNAKFHCLFGYVVPYLIQNPVVSLLVGLVYTYFLYTTFMSYVHTLETNIANQKQSNWIVVQEKAATLTKIFAAGAAVKIVYEMAKKLRTARQIQNSLTQQSYVEPSDAEIAKRDASDVTATIAVEQNWANVTLAPLPSSKQSKTIAEEDLFTLCKKNTAVVMVGDKAVTNIFFVKSNVAIIPTHLIKKWTDKLCVIVRHDITAIGGNFKCFLSACNSAPIPNTDLSLIWVPNGGDWKNLLKYFPTEIFKDDCGARLCTRKAAGDIQEYKVRTKCGNNQLVSCMAYGYAYTIDSYIGMCGAPLMAQKIAPMIIGVHVAGRVEKKMGFSSALAQSDIEYALEVLSEKPGVLISHSTGTLSPEIFGKPMLDEQAIHVKSPVRKLEVTDVTPNCVVYGSCSGRATYYSKVVESVISPVVEKVCQIPQRWGRPKFNLGNGWIETLKYSSLPSHGIEPTLVQKAVKDYVKPLIKMLQDRPNLKASITPLTKMQNICGIDGVKFIDKIDRDTAIGHPLTGSKSKYVTLLDPDDFEDFSCPAELDPIFWEEYERAIECWDKEERYHPVFKAFFKDEPTPLDKDKVRVVQGAPMVLLLATRKYFLPIARFISLFPALSECAVGLNCMGPDWEDFQAHITKHGKDRMLAGDYSKYDLRMPAQITLAAFHVLIDMAEKCGYSERDLRIMRGIATDICYPTIAFNGDLLQFIGFNPSGHPLTVYINCICNSILLRCAFFHYYPTSENFRKVVAVGTYGDDLLGSVSASAKEYNHISVAKFLADHDMKFTMPDKTSAPTEYMHCNDADFLKRKNVFIPELGRHVGAIDEDSIFKSLHSNLRSKALTPQELAATNIDAAIRDWFFHGREVCERRRKEMKQVACESGIENQCKMLDVTFDEQVATWKERYPL